MSLRYNPFTGNFDFDTKPTGGSGSSIWDRISSSVSSSTTGVVDSITNASFRSLKYIVTVFNDSNTVYESYEYNILNENGSYKETRSHRLKTNGFNTTINTNNNAGTLELQITNNEAFDVTVEIGRLVLA